MIFKAPQVVLASLRWASLTNKPAKVSSSLIGGLIHSAMSHILVKQMIFKAPQVVLASLRLASLTNKPAKASSSLIGGLIHSAMSHI